MIRFLITDFKKINLYGDLELISATRSRCKFRGKLLKVKILGLFWITYKSYYI